MGMQTGCTVNIILLYTYRMFLLPSLKRFSPLRDQVSKYTTTANKVHVPKVQQKGLNTMKRVVNSITVELYCICHGPDFPRMACCDNCHGWFHEGCLNIPKEVFEDEEIPWKCPDCCECWIYKWFIYLICSDLIGPNLQPWYKVRNTTKNNCVHIIDLCDWGRANTVPHAPLYVLCSE